MERRGDITRRGQTRGKEAEPAEAPQAPLMGHERGTEEKVVIIGGMEIPWRDEGENVTERQVSRKRRVIQEKGVG